MASVRRLVNLPAKRLAQLQTKNVKEKIKTSFRPQIRFVRPKQSSLGGFMAVGLFLSLLPKFK